uniref:Uncharacterized protein n=1 Tax=Plectus sambesii TaxID=2011161 RepID=A0A914V0J9_9BILA
MVTDALWRRTTLSPIPNVSAAISWWLPDRERIGRLGRFLNRRQRRRRRRRRKNVFAGLCRRALVRLLETLWGNKQKFCALTLPGRTNFCASLTHRSLVVRTFDATQ